jgi:cytochrome c oxidase subunit 1
MGIVAEIIATNTRKPLFGYRELVGSLILIGILSFVVWAHHMFLSGMRSSLANLFVTTTITISIPSVAVLTCSALSLRGGSIRFNTPMLLRAGVPADVRHRWLDGPTARLRADGPASARHVLRDRALPLRRRAGEPVALIGGTYYWFPKMFGG